jgi:hypothetical protein
VPKGQCSLPLRQSPTFIARDKKSFGFVDIFCKKESLGFSIRQQGFKPSQTKEFVGAGLAPPAVAAPPKFNLDEDVNKAI